MKLPSKIAGKILLLCCTLLFSSAATSKSSDADQALNIEADSVEFREKQGISIYQGNVKITKGSLLIQGQLIRIHTAHQQLQKIRVEGKPARFKQLNDDNQEVSAQSLKMEYSPNKGLLILDKEAHLVQHKNRFTSDRIVYDINKDIVHAGQKDDQTDDQKVPGAETTQPARVTITIHPEKDKAVENENSANQKP